MVEVKMELQDGILDNALKEALHTKIVEALGQAGRDRIINEAVGYLTRPENNHRYDKPVSPLMGMVYQCARDVAEAYIKTQFEGDTELARQVQAIYAEAMQKLFGVEAREKLVEKLIKNFDKVLGERY